MAIKIDEGPASDSQERAVPADRLAKVVKAAKAAEFQAGLCADEVRQQAEARLGIGPPDERAWDDPEYGSALDLLGRPQKLREAANARR